MDQTQITNQNKATPVPGFHTDAVVSKWFRDEEFYWRSLASNVWLAVIFPLLFALFVFCVNVSILSPLAWIAETFSMLFTLTTISCIVLLQIVCSLATIPHAKAMSVQKSPTSTNLKLVVFLLRPKQLFSVGCFTGFSFLMTSILKRYCSSNSDNSVFLSFLGLFHGLFYTVLYYKKHSYLAEFPIVQQTRFFRFKKLINVCLRDTLGFSLKTLPMYYVLYVLSCAILPNFLSTNNDVSFSSAIISIVNISLLLDCFCISLVVVAVLHVSNTLIKIFNTQAYTFPIIAMTTDEENKTLVDAMESSDVLLKHLACLDYNILSRYQRPRRMEMFDLSAPGNRAHCWNRTSQEAVRIIEDMRTQLIQENGRKQELKCMLLKPTLPKTIGSRGLFSAPEETTTVVVDDNKSWFPSPSKFLSSLTKSAEQKKKRVTFANSPLQKNGTMEPVTIAPVKPFAAKPPVKAVGPVNVFEHLQTTLWCIEGLSNLAAVSLTEDKYGVVQKKLPETIEGLLLLLEACEVYLKSLFNVPSSNHSYHVEAAQLNTRHATTLKLAVKTGLYTITTAFGYHISSVRLPCEHKKRLHAFLEFAE